MTDNTTTRDASGNPVTVRTSDDGTAKAGVFVSEMSTPSANFTRPADTTAYAANDAVNNSTSAPTVMTFTGMARTTGMGGIIAGATLHVGEKNATAAEFHLWLFDTSPTMNNDNAAFAPASGDLANLVGVLIFSPTNMSDATGMRVYQAINCPLPYRAAATGLYGALQTRTAFTPSSACTFRVKLHLVKET